MPGFSRRKSAEKRALHRARSDERWQELIDTSREDSQAKRLIERLRRHQHELFTFLDRPDVPFDNNQGERTIRPAAIIHKSSLAGCVKGATAACPRAPAAVAVRRRCQRSSQPAADGVATRR